MPYLLVLAKLDPERKRTFGAVATVSRLSLVHFEKVEAALAWLEAHEPRVVVFDSSVLHADKLCRKVRSKKSLAGVPIIATAEEAADALVERLYGQGADDVVPSALGASLIARLKSLPEIESLSTATHGVAVVADKEHARCDVIGRVLMNAGYDVKFALDDVALRYYTQQSQPKLVVLNAEVGDARKFVDEATVKGLRAAWVVLASRRDLVKQAELLAGVERLAVVASSTPPENVLFTSNELMRQGGAPSREHERVLYGTAVSYKAAGGDHDDFGFTYNISSSGLYVRTLAPPEGSEVWLELRPPRGKRRVRLEAQVMWRRSYDPASGAVVPPGFGVVITDGLGSSVELWKSNVESFIRSTRRGPAAVAALLEESLGDVRASRPDFDRDSVSHIAAIPVSLPPQALELTRGAAAPAAPSPVKELVPAGPPLSDLAAELEPEPGPEVAAPEPRLEPAPSASAPPDRQPPAEAIATPQPSPPVAPTPRRRSPVVWAAVAVTLVAAAGSTAVVLELGPFARPAPTESAAALPRAPSVPAGLPSPVPSVEASASAAASASVAPVAAVEPPNTADLKWDEGYLIVKSSAKVDVYATGFKVGPTNRANKSKCGLRFVRLGEKEPPRWLGPGHTVNVLCRATTELELAPE